MRHVKLIVFFAVLMFCVCVIGAAHAQEIEKDPVQLLRSTAERFEKIRTYRCKATCIYKVYNGKKETTYQDVVLYSFQKPKSIKMEK